MTDNFDRKQPPQLTEQDAELLSAYLDGMLERDQHSALERRLAQDAFLRAELDALRQTVSWIQTLPELRAPRNFTLQPEVATQLTAPQILSLPRRSFRPVWTALTSAAAVFVFLIGALLVLRPSIGGIFNPLNNDPAPLTPPVVAVAATPVPQLLLDVQVTASPVSTQISETVAQFSAPAAEEEQTMLADSAALAGSSVSQSADANQSAEVARTLESSAAPQQGLAGAAAAEAKSAGAVLRDLLVALLRLTLIILQGNVP